MNQIELIQSKIYEIRGQKVMQDFDLAEMYGVETKRLKESVRRNKRRFPSDFMFELSKEEFDGLRSQNSSSNKRGGIRYMPFVFTEQGVAMLSSILNNEVAIIININIMRAFVTLRKLITAPQPDRIDLLDDQLQKFKTYVEDAFTDYNDINEDTRMQLELINQTLAELQADKKLVDKPRRPIGFKTP